MEITAWGRGKESWSIDYRVFEGDTSRSQVWEKLTGLLNESFPTESGLELPILQLAVDSGFATIEVHQWARRQGGRVLVIKGDSRTPALIGSASPVEVGPMGAKLKRGVRVWPRRQLETLSILRPAPTNTAAWAHEFKARMRVDGDDAAAGAGNTCESPRPFLPRR